MSFITFRTCCREISLIFLNMYVYDMHGFNTRKVAVLNTSLIMKITAKEKDVNDI